MMDILQVKNPQGVLPPSLGASMYAIACILSYDGLSTILRDADASDPHGSKLDVAEKNKSASGRKGFGYITPGPFLRSLMSDNARVNFSRPHKVTGPMPNAPPAKFRHQKPRNNPQAPFHGRGGAAATAIGNNGGGNGVSPRNPSFKRRRPGRG